VRASDDDVRVCVCACVCGGDVNKEWKEVRIWPCTLTATNTRANTSAVDNTSRERMCCGCACVCGGGGTWEGTYAEPERATGRRLAKPDRAHVPLLCLVYARRTRRNSVPLLLACQLHHLRSTPPASFCSQFVRANFTVQMEPPGVECKCMTTGSVAEVSGLARHKHTNWSQFKKSPSQQLRPVRVQISS
jgi:hypothetical protein